MNRLRFALALVCACTTSPQRKPRSSEVVARPEITELGIGLAPIVHTDSAASPFMQEPERFGYEPRFDPGFVTFDFHDRPYFHVHRRDAASTCPSAHDGWFDQDLIETLGADGAWTTIDLTRQALATLPPVDGKHWNGCYRSGHQYDERVVFDREGAAYTYIAATQSNVPFGILMYSRDGGVTWIGYWLRNDVQSVTGADAYEGWQATLEFQDGHNLLDGPPNILIHGFFAEWGSSTIPRDLFLMTPVKSGTGLTFPQPVRITTSANALLATEHSGASNKTVHSRGNRTHVVFAATTAPDGVQCGGTPVYARTYDHSAKAFTSPPVFVACSGTDDHGGSGPDDHDSPAIAVDSRGYLHVVLGAHQGSLQYVRSSQPDSTAGWSAPVEIGEPKQPHDGGYTYVSLICDGRDVLHVVARYAGLGYYFRLVYLRRSASGEWDTFGTSARDPIDRPGLTLHHQHLVIPATRGYAVYHHKLDVDRHGNLYASYETFAQQFGDSEARDYCVRFQDDRYAWLDGARQREASSCERGQLKKDCSACRTSGGLIPYRSVGASPLGQRCTYCETPKGCPVPPYCDYTIATNAHAAAMLTSRDGGASWHLATTRDFVDGSANR